MKYKNIHAATQVTGIRLKELRESAGLTPTTLGKKINKHHNTILHIENGTTDPSIMVLSQILAALGMEFHDFFDNRYDELFEKAVCGDIGNE